MATNELSTLIANPEMLGLERQRKMAQALLQQGMQTPQGEMIGNRYVPANPMQFLGNLFNVYAGQKGLENIDLKEAELAKALREQGVKDVNDILTLSQGRPELPSQELAGPAYNGVKPSIQYPAIEPNPQEALSRALLSQSPQAQSLVAPLTQNLLPKKTDKMIEYELYKQQTPADKRLGFTDWADRIEKERLAIDRQRLALEAANQNKPQIIETANGFVAVNPRNPSQVTPLEINGQTVMGSKGALTGEGAKQVTGAKNLQDSIAEYQQKLKNFSTLDMANPDARAQMGQAYNNMMLQAKEAYNLGVLNGPDYNILTSVVKDPTSAGALFVSKKTLDSQAENLSKTADKIIKNVYEIHNKPLPANLQSNQTASTKQPQTATTVQRAYIGSEPIIVQNGKWVYEKTGKAVE